VPPSCARRSACGDAASLAGLLRPLRVAGRAVAAVIRKCAITATEMVVLAAALT
jgi:hypothetical protein